jgi:hypothetical protein
LPHPHPSIRAWKLRKSPRDFIGFSFFVCYLFVFATHSVNYLNAAHSDELYILNHHKKCNRLVFFFFWFDKENLKYKNLVFAIFWPMQLQTKNTISKKTLKHTIQLIYPKKRYEHTLFLKVIIIEFTHKNNKKR